MRTPLFPLQTVLLPGTRMPLHIFEPRYRQMLHDCLSGDRRFGFIQRPDDIDERRLPAGTVGCRAYIDDVEMLADGRANIVVRGDERFSLVAIHSDAAPYLVAEFAEFTDHDEPVAQQTALALRLRELFDEAVTAARALSDEPAPAPVLADDPRLIAFAAAASIDLDVTQRQRLLASPSPSARMRDMITLIDGALPSLRQRAQAHAQSKSNGHGPRTHA